MEYHIVLGHAPSSKLNFDLQKNRDVDAEVFCFSFFGSYVRKF